MYTNKPSGGGAIDPHRREGGSRGEVLAVVVVEEVDDVRWLVGGSPNCTPSLAVPQAVVARPARVSLAVLQVHPASALGHYGSGGAQEVQHRILAMQRRRKSLAGAGLAGELGRGQHSVVAVTARAVSGPA